MAENKYGNVTTSEGTWEIVKPKAGIRNRALEKAETSDGGFKRMVLLTTMLPSCINKRPSNIDPDVPIEQVLDGLEIEDYDKLIDGLGRLINPAAYEEEDAKKASGTL
jgi:hypothetical protein